MTRVIKTTVITAYIAVIVAMGVATIAEKINGTTDIYTSWWFCALWAVLAIAGIVYILRQQLIRKPVVFTMHVALVTILAGALVSHVWGEQTTMHLRQGDVNSQLPFMVRLDQFKVVNYPGTQSPMDYVSRLLFIDAGGEKSEAVVSMNNIAEHDGYRFYQAAYDYDGMGTVLSISHDPWGIALTYIGYFMLFLTMTLMLILPNEGFRKALREVSKHAMALAMMLASTSAMAQTKVLPADVADEMCDIYVYYNERICPLQTVAKDFTTKLCGKLTYQGLSAEQVMTGWYFFPTTWTAEPMIKIKGGEKKYMSFDEMSARNNGTFDDEKLNIIRMLLGGQMMNIYPYVEKGELVWLNQGDNLPLDMPEEQWFFIKKSLDYMGELAVMNDYDKFKQTVRKIKEYQQQTAQDVLPCDVRFEAEKIYNRLCYTRPLAMGLATIGIVMFVCFVIRWSKGEQMPRWVIVVLNMLVGIVTLYLFIVIALRGYVANHLPITNGYETMQFMALTALVLTLVMQRKFVLIFPFGLLLAGLTLMVSMFGESNPQVTNLMPVLSSPLLCIHVCVIMISYSLLAFMMFNGITALIMEAMGKPERSQMLSNVSRLLIYPALFMLTAGIFIGAIWANQSWGRYWGWDPKEVWALITMMVYAVPMHKSIVPVLSKPRQFNIFTVVAFMTVLMTYFGVNFLLGGMHSYANS